MTKIENLMQQINTQIEQKIWLAGTRIPSVRQYAASMQCSVSTVVEAYARLVSLGILQSRPGAGYFVSASSSMHKAVLNELNDPALAYSREVDPLWISRQSLEAPQNMLKPGCGWLPAAWMPEQTMRKALKQAAKADLNVLFEYAVPHGHIGLRRYIARKCENYDVTINLKQILLTDSATHAIDLLFRHFLKPSDTVLIDDPCYFNFKALIKAHGLNFIAVPFGSHGPDIAFFRAALKHQPKMYLTNSGIHNPTGAVLSLQNAFHIAKLAEKSGLIIVEDEIFYDFEDQPAPRYLTLLGVKQVVQIGSFTKTLSAAVRCGYVIAEEQTIENLINLSIATHFNTGHLNAEIIYQALTGSGYQRHIDHLKKQLHKALIETIKQLALIDIYPEHMPTAGLFLWCRLPKGIDAAELSKRCLEKGVILAPGNSFSQADNAHQFMRFNVAQCMNKRIFDCLSQTITEIRALENTQLGLENGDEIIASV